MRALLLFFLVQTSSVLAQNYFPIKKTQLNKFVEESSIEWAIYKNDTLRTDSPDLRDILLRKMINKKIEIFEPIYINGTDDDNKIIYTKPELIYDHLNHGGNIGYDRLGNKIFYKATELIELINYLPKGVNNLYQILYIKNRKLLAYISHASPLFDITSPQGTHFGRIEYFSTAINIKPFSSNSSKDKIIFLKKTTTEFYVDSIKKENKLKEMFGHNIIETLWPYIENNKIVLYSVPENKKITLHEINKENLLNLQTVNVPIYDSVGNLSGTKLIVTEIISTIFDRIIITQEWYYNETKNIVFCKIPDAILSIPKLNMEDTATHEIKIVF